MKNKVLVIVGPTGSGKSDAALRAAHALGGEVVSADSMQIYKGMDIGTAKLMPAAQEGVPHHLLDIVTPDEAFTVADYQKRAMAAIRDILTRGGVPIVCGGSGLYVNSITHDLNFADEAGPVQDLRREMDGMTHEALYERLRHVDADAAERIHPNNIVRVRRAIEIAAQRSASSYDFERQNPDFDFVIFGISPQRTILRERLDRRVDRMVAAGLVAEVRQLNERYPAARVLSQAIGYKELQHARTPDEIDEGVERIRTGTKQFAKRQMTWFKRDGRITWYEEGNSTMIEDIRRRMAKEPV